MSMVERIKAVEEAYLAADADSGMAGIGAAIAAALDEAEKVDKDLDERIRVAVAWSQKAAMADAKWRRARGAGRRLEWCGAFGDINAVTEYFFGGGEGEG